MGHLSQTTTAESEVAVIAARASANSAAVVQTHGVIFAFADKHPPFVFFIDHRCFGHDSLFLPLASLSYTVAMLSGA